MDVVLGQCVFFGQSILFAMAVFFLYDGFRILRRLLSHGFFSILVEDVAYWLVVAVATFRFLCGYNGGQLRGFFFLGLGIGTAIYLHWMSRYVVAFGVRCLRRLGKKPRQMLCQGRFWTRKCIRKRKRQLKNHQKEVKIVCRGKKKWGETSEGKKSKK